MKRCQLAELDKITQQFGTTQIRNPQCKALSSYHRTCWHFSPNVDFETFAGKLAGLQQHVKNTPLPVIIAGDFNSKSSKWHAEKPDRGVIADGDLVIFNAGTGLTFQRGVQGTIIDITIASLMLAN
uniref:Endo/exonuclease/phosphatase domain-containing protein n=1 Tax=Glossina austeni TaxID=7395 RepID=A0A1A9UWM7_GLOAU